MKTVVCRIIEGASRHPMVPGGEMGLRFIDPADCMFAIELEDGEQLKNLDITAVPNSSRTVPMAGANGDMINVATSLYAFRAVAVSAVDKSAEEVMADVRELQEAGEDAGVDGEHDSISQGESKSDKVSHAEPVPGDEEA